MVLQLTLRYANAGMARISLNGFLLVNDLTGESGSLRLEPYAVPGINILRVETPPASPGQTTAQVAKVSDADGSVVQMLCEVAHSDVVKPEPASQVSFELPAHLPRWTWMSAQPAPAGSERLIPETLESLALALTRGPDDVLLQQLALKHGDIGAALGIGKDRMDRGLLQSLAARRASADFRADVVAAQDLQLVWSPDRRVVRALRRDGRDAIQLHYQGDWSGFAVSLAFGAGRWWILR